MSTGTTSAHTGGFPTESTPRRRWQRMCEDARHSGKWWRGVIWAMPRWRDVRYFRGRGPEKELLDARGEEYAADAEMRKHFPKWCIAE